MKIGVNTFGLRKDLKRDFDGTLKCLKEIGFDLVEVCLAGTSLRGAFGDQMDEERQKWMEAEAFDFSFWAMDDVAKERILKVREAGFEVSVAHLALPQQANAEDMEKLTEEAAAFAKEEGLSAYVVSAMKDLEGMKAYAPLLQQMAERLAEAGVQLLYHNHDIECRPEAGTTAFDYTLQVCPKLQAEPDVGWMVMGGGDPVTFIGQNRERIPYVHLKDFKKEKSDPEYGNERFAAIGEGLLPLQEVLQTVKEQIPEVKAVIIDQDASTGSFLEDLATGYGNVTRVLEKIDYQEKIKDKWLSTGGAMKPVDLSEIEFVNRPKNNE